MNLPPKSSGYRGVTLFKPSGKWRAQVSGAEGGDGREGHLRALPTAGGGPLPLAHHLSRLPARLCCPPLHPVDVLV